MDFYYLTSTRIESQTTIAQLCSLIIANSEEVLVLNRNARKLLKYCQHINPAVRGIARYSLTKCICDIRPDYRIDKNMSDQKRSKDVAKRELFEQCFISVYHRLLTIFKQALI